MYLKSLIKNKELLQKFLYILLCTFVFLFIIYFVYTLSLRHVIEHDDASMYTDGNFIYNYIINVYKAKYLGNFLTVFFGFDIPKLLSIHPVVWIQTGGAVVKGIFTTILVFVITSSLYLFKKKDLLYPIIALLIYIYIQCTVMWLYQSELYASFYCFTFQCLFFALFWQKFIKEYLKQQNENNDLYVLSLLAFLNGTSSEMTSIGTFVSLVLFIVYILFKDRYITKPVIYSIISLIIGMALYFLHPQFIESAQRRDTFDGNTIQNAIQMLPEYIQGYKSVFLEHFIVPVLIILIISVLIYVFNSEQKIKNISILCVMQLIGCFAFYSALLFAGRNFENECYVIHFDIIYQMINLFIIIIFLQLAFFYKNAKFYYTYLTLFLIYLYITPYNVCFYYYYNPTPNIFNQSYISKEDYNERYLLERISAYYIYSNTHKIILSENAKRYAFERYLKGLYGYNPETSEIVYVNSTDEAYNKYLNNGGCSITDSDIQKADFQKLLDKNYILTCGN